MTVHPRLSAIIVALLFASTLPAQVESLKLVPKNAQIFSATLHARDQFEVIAKSRAWAKLNSLPIVKMGWAQLEQEWNKEGGGLAPFRVFYEQPENRELVQLLIDMLGQEMFFYGGDNSAEFIQLLQEMQGASQMAPLVAAAQGNLEGAQDPETRVRILLQTLAKNPKMIVVPNIIFGFKLSDTKVAKAQLKRLDPLIELAGKIEAKFKNAVSKTTINGGDYYVLKVDGKMAPWDMLPIRKYEENAGDFDPLIERLQNLKVTISVGLRDDFLLVALGQSTKLLEGLGKQPLLVDRPEFKPLAKHAERKLSGIAYVSQEWQDKIMSVNLVEMADEIVKNLKDTGLTEAKQKKLQGEIKAWAADLQKMMPVPGASLTLSFLTNTGEETYQYDWTKNHGWDSSKPLTILQHVGSTPLLVAAGRGKYSPQDYQTLVKLCKGVHQAFEEYGLPLLGEEQQQHYKMVFGKVEPLLKRLDKATGDMLVPALADSQCALVIDGKLTSKQWHMDLPPAQKPLAILEPALVFGVSDAELLRQACEEYWAVANDVIALAGQFSPEAAQFKLPLPKTKKDKNGELYYYDLPEEAGVDKKLTPTAGLGKTVAALTISVPHAARLLATTPFKGKAELKIDTARPLAAAAYVDWPGIVDTVAPWVEMGFQTAGLANDEVLDQTRTVVQILKVLRGFTSVTYTEEDALVTHSRSVFKDIAP